MPRRFCIFTLAFVAFVLAGCTKSEEDLKKAQRATDGLMPAEEPKFEAEYVADQSQVKLVAPRTVSYEPLETFREKSKSEPADEESGSEEPSEKTSAKAMPPVRSASGGKAPSGGGNFWSRVAQQALMGGAAPPPQAAPKGEAPAKKGDQVGKKKGGDDEESVEEDSGEEETKDSKSDGD